MIQFKNNHATVFQSALFQTTSTVIQTNDCIVLIDPNWLPHEIKAIQDYIREIRADRTLYLLFTHGDFDHIIGYEAFPDAVVIGSKGLQEHPQKERKLSLIEQFDNDYYIKRDYPISFPKIDIVIEEDGQTLQVGSTKLTFYTAPGHTRDGIFTLIEPLGIWIAGDYLSDFELPFVYDSVKAYLQTMQKAREILQTSAVTLLVPGHGRSTTSQEEMKKRIEMSETYLERLKTAVLNNDEEALRALEEELPFPSDFTKACFEQNKKIALEEYGTQTV